MPPNQSVQTNNIATQPQTMPSSQMLTPEQNDFINHFSWGAIFFQPWHYFATNLILYGFLIMFIPVYNIYLYFKGIFSARKMSWETGEWKDFEQFKKRQKLMDKIGIIFFIFILVIFTASFSVLGVTIFGSNGPVKVATSFIENISKGNTHEAFLNGSKTLKEIGTEEDFAQFTNQYLASSTDVSFNSIKIVNSKSVACGTFVDSVKSIKPIVVYMGKEVENQKSVWKVDGLNLEADVKCEVESDKKIISEASPKDQSEVSITDDLQMQKDSKEYEDFAKKVIGELVKGNTSYLKDNLSPNTLKDISKEDLDNFLSDVKKKFINFDKLGNSITTRPSGEMGKTSGYSFAMTIIYKDQTEKDFKIYVLKENDKLVVANII